MKIFEFHSPFKWLKIGDKQNFQPGFIGPLVRRGMHEWVKHVHYEKWYKCFCFEYFKELNFCCWEQTHCIGVNLCQQVWTNIYVFYYYKIPSVPIAFDMKWIWNVLVDLKSSQCHYDMQKITMIIIWQDHLLHSWCLC